MMLFRLTQSSALSLLIGTFLLRFNGGANTVFMGRFLAGMGVRNGLVITSIEVGLLSVVFFVVELTLSPVMGSLSDRWGRRLFLWLGPLLGIIQATLLFFTPGENTFGYLLCL